MYPKLLKLWISVKRLIKILFGIQTIRTSIVSDCKKLCFVDKPPLTISKQMSQKTTVTLICVSGQHLVFTFFNPVLGKQRQKFGARTRTIRNKSPEESSENSATLPGAVSNRPAAEVQWLRDRRQSNCSEKKYKERCACCCCLRSILWFLKPTLFKGIEKCT